MIRCAGNDYFLLSSTEIATGHSVCVPILPACVGTILTLTGDCAALSRYIQHSHKLSPFLFSLSLSLRAMTSAALKERDKLDGARYRTAAWFFAVKGNATHRRTARSIHLAKLLFTREISDSRNALGKACIFEGEMENQNSREAWDKSHKSLRRSFCTCFFFFFSPLLNPRLYFTLLSIAIDWIKSQLRNVFLVFSGYIFRTKIHDEYSRDLELIFWSVPRFLVESIIKNFN